MKRAAGEAISKAKLMFRHGGNYGLLGVWMNRRLSVVKVWWVSERGDSLIDVVEGWWC